MQKRELLNSEASKLDLNGIRAGYAGCVVDGDSAIVIILNLEIGFRAVRLLDVAVYGAASCLCRVHADDSFLAEWDAFFKSLLVHHHFARVACKCKCKVGNSGREVVALALVGENKV